MTFRPILTASLLLSILSPQSMAADTENNAAAGTPASVSGAAPSSVSSPSATLDSTTAATGSSASTAAVQSTTGATAVESTAGGASAVKPANRFPKVTNKWKPGQELEISTKTEDLVPTDDVNLARKQMESYPDSPEAAFILAVALTRTSHVEDALKEVRRARKLAELQGGTAYFDKMIATYEDMLKNFPAENRVRYSLAWAYYMKAYLVANYSRKVAAWKAVHGDPNQAKKTDSTAAVAAEQKSPVVPADVKPVASGKMDMAKIAQALAAAATGGDIPKDSIPKIPSIFDRTDPSDAGQIRSYFELALKKLDDLVAQKPDDVWALVYRAHLKAEYSGNLSDAMQTWTTCRDRFPNNPAPYFFLGEGYLKQGNLKESINNVSRAVALRSMGF